MMRPRCFVQNHSLGKLLHVSAQPGELVLTTFLGRSSRFCCIVVLVLYLFSNFALCCVVGREEISQVQSVERLKSASCAREHFLFRKESNLEEVTWKLESTYKSNLSDQFWNAEEEVTRGLNLESVPRR